MENYNLCDKMLKVLPMRPVRSANYEALLKSLYEDLSHQFDLSVPTDTVQLVKTSDTPHFGKEDIFIPALIRDKIRATTEVTQSIFRFNLPSGREVHVYVWIPHKNRVDYSKKVSEKIYRWMRFLDHHASCACSKRLTIYIYLTKIRKTLPPPPKPLERTEVNSAFTFACRTNNEIYIFREEEWFKVLIHETMHSLGLDFSDIHYPQASQNIRDLVFSGVSAEYINLAEAYTETWAEVFNILVTVYTITREKAYTRTVSQIVGKCLYYEKCWALVQMFKVLIHQNTTYLNLLYGEEYIEHDSRVFSYYGLKAVLMFHLEEFVLWCREHRRPTEPVFMFKSEPETIDSLGTFMIEHATHPLLVTSMEALESFVPYMNRSLLMSLWG